MSKLCQKCGYSQIDTAFLERGAVIDYSSLEKIETEFLTSKQYEIYCRVESAKDHMAYKCCRCGYGWRENVKEQEEEPVEEKPVNNQTPITDYAIAKKPSIDRLYSEVNAMIQQGWQPMGGITKAEQEIEIAAGPNMSETIYCQPMVKIKSVVEQKFCEVCFDDDCPVYPFLSGYFCLYHLKKVVDEHKENDI
jgi:hypothetical protein